MGAIYSQLQNSSRSSNGSAATNKTAQAAEVARCYQRPAYFLARYGQIYDPAAERWALFGLWDPQRTTLATLHAERLVCVLKARQLGLTWLALGYALWAMIFRPEQTVLIFSQRDTDAMYLLGRERLRGMWERLPDFLTHRLTVRADAAHEWGLSNGSTARAFPTTGGRSYAATLAIVDEADFVDDLGAVLNAVKPTIDAGGKLILISTSDKGRPESAFKRIYRGAVAGENDYRPVFLPWDARPDRTPGWYDEQRRDFLARDGTLDGLWQEYPANDFQALAPRTLDKRFPADWLQACAEVRAGTRAPNGAQVYEPAQPARSYVIGADPAEGNPQSDESAATVVDMATGAQVAIFAGRFEPEAFAAGLKALSEQYNKAPALVERNNHGHAVILWLKNFAPKVDLLLGLDGKPGWLTSGASKPLALDRAAAMLRDGAVRIRDQHTLTQLEQLSGSTLAAPEGQHDDRAMALVLALAGLQQPKAGGVGRVF